jgi:aspartyl aminopeptidase
MKKDNYAICGLVGLSLVLLGGMGGCSLRKPDQPAPYKEFAFNEMLIKGDEDSNLEATLSGDLMVSGWDSWVNDNRKRMTAFARGYLRFIADLRTESELIEAVLAFGKKNGYQLRGLYDRLTESDLAPGNKLLFQDPRSENLVLVYNGTKPLSEGVRILVSSLDLPHLLIKQNPVFVKNGHLLMQTAYTGYPRKHQWLSIPLGLRGTIKKSDGSTVRVKFGSEDTPALVIPDLLPHLSYQTQRNMLIKAEDLDVLVDGTPLAQHQLDEKTGASFYQALQDQYGISKDDFVSSQWELVPLYLPAEVGVDKGFIGAYGQTALLPAYTVLQTLNKIKEPEYTALVVLVNGLDAGEEFKTFASALKPLFATLVQGQSGAEAEVEQLVRTGLAKSEAVYTGVMAGVNPVFKDGWAEVAYGPVVIVSHEDVDFVNGVIKVFKRDKILWQILEKQYREREADYRIEREGVACLNLLCPLLAQGSSIELVSKMDLYLTYLALRAFLEK